MYQKNNRAEYSKFTNLLKIKIKFLYNRLSNILEKNLTIFILIIELKKLLKRLSILKVLI